MKRSFLVTLFLGVLAITSCTKSPVQGEGIESGTRWKINQTADETANSGLRLILSYDPATLTFSGTLENTSSNLIPLTRVEVHAIDANGVSTEFGPTPGVDMAAGAKRNISLTITSGLNPVEYTIHAEFGAPGQGG